MHGLGDALLEGAAKFGDKVKTFGGDAHHDLAAVICGVHTLDVAELFEAVDETGGGGGGVPHLARDVRHGHLTGCAQVAEKVELAEGNVSAAQVFGQVEKKLALAEKDEIRELPGIFRG